MDSKRLQQALDLFDRAVTLDSVDHAKWLKEETGGDDEITAYVLQMLANDTRAQQSIKTAAGYTPFDVSQNWVGAHFGPYRITKLLGEGGMSLVYLAERMDGAYEGIVALKLIKNPNASADIKRRFEQERQVLADLRHPNIATLLDAGSTPDLEYLVLEYIDGEPFYEFQKNLPLATTLQLFRDVCSAVEHAHQALIVHRDIKPGNILVTKDGVAKLLDFGIAKDLGLANDAATAWTLTPAYASPEQISGQTITLATDIYSLGVLLYEALADKRPHEVTNLAPGEAVSELLETTPVVPSSLSTRMTGLNRHEREDLDAIVMRAMAKDPKQRYRNVASLMDDLDAYAKGQPVAAHKGSRWYLVAKFVKRNKIPVGATALATVALLVALIVALNQVQRANEQLARSEAVSRYLQDILTAPDPTWNSSIVGGPGVTVAQTLESAEMQLDNDLLDQPLVRIELYEAMGSAQMWLDNKEAALSARRKALDLRRSTFPGDQEQEAVGLMRLAEVHDDWKESEISLPIYLQAIEKFKSSGAKPNEFLTLLYNDTAIAFFNDHQYANALAYQFAALELSRNTGTKKNRSDRGIYQINYGRALLEAGKTREAAEQLEKIRQAFGKSDAVPSFYLSRLFHTSGVASIRMGNYQDAVSYFSKAVDHTLQDNHEGSNAELLRAQCWMVYAQLHAGASQRTAAQARILELAKTAEAIEPVYLPVTWAYHFVRGVDAAINNNKPLARAALGKAHQLSQDRQLRITGVEREIIDRYTAEYN